MDKPSVFVGSPRTVKGPGTRRNQQAVRPGASRRLPKETQARLDWSGDGNGIEGVRRWQGALSRRSPEARRQR